MYLPNGTKAVVDIGKLRDYVLNPVHPIGMHKARVFKSELQMEQLDAESLHSNCFWRQQPRKLFRERTTNMVRGTLLISKLPMRVGVQPYAADGFV